MTNAVVLGKHGLIGSAIVRRLKRLDITVQEYPNEMTAVIFDMTGPTHIAFEKSFYYCSSMAMHQLLTMVPYAKDIGAVYVYPSSALVYEKETPFVHIKRASEEYIRSVNGKYIIARIWPTYGDEEHKGEFASIMYQWDQQIKNDEQPEIYGDGTQERGFIHADDVARRIVDGWLQEKFGTYDVEGEIKSFNQILSELNEKHGKNIEPKYIPAPDGYSSKSPEAKSPL